MKNKKFIATRFSSMILDHIIMSSLIVGIVAVFGIIGFIIFKLTNTTSEALPEYFIVFLAPIFLLIMSVYFNKDGIKGKSPAKRILGLTVVDNKTGIVASPVKSVLRNITLVFWPIEVIMTIFSPNRRIGDYIAGTRVTEIDNVPESEFILSNLIISLLIGCVYLIPIIGLQILLIGFNPYHGLGL